jgi:hypothetical protein
VGSSRRRAAVVSVVVLAFVMAGFTVWVADGAGSSGGPSRARLVRFLPTVINTRALAVSDDAVWIAGDVSLRPQPGLRKEVHRLDPSTGRLVAKLEVPALELGLAGGALWAWDGYDLRRIDARTNKVTHRARVRVPQETDYDYFDAADMLVTDDAVWVGSEHALLRFDLSTGRVVRRIPLDGAAGTITEDGDGIVWVHIGENVNVDLDGVDPRTNRRAQRVRCLCWVLGSTSDGRLWVEIEDGLGTLTPAKDRSYADVHDVLAGDTKVDRAELVDDTFWWTRTFSAANVPVDDVVEALNVSDVQAAVRHGFAVPTAAVTVQSLGAFTVHEGTAWFVGWRRTIGDRLYHWTP